MYVDTFACMFVCVHLVHTGQNKVPDPLELES